MARNTDRLLIVLSDLEMGAGGRTDDCPHSPVIAEHLLAYHRAHRNTPIDFVFNGDTLDFLKTTVDGAHPRHVSASVALAKLDRITRAHPVFFDTLGEILSAGGVARRVWFVVGNHDFELLFPRVQRALEQRVGAGLVFPGLALTLGDVRIEHGSQGDPLFAIDPKAPFIEHEGERILHLPWGAVGLLDAVLPYHYDLCLLDRVRPRQTLFSLLPEAETLMTAVARRYWLGDFLRDALLERDPLKPLRLDIAREVVRRLVAKHAEVGFGDHYVAELRQDDAPRLIVVGHEHVARTHVEGQRTLLATSCLRSEYMLDARGGLTPAPKCLAEVWLAGDRVRSTRLAPVDVPEIHPVPEDIRALRPLVERHLAQLEPSPELWSALAYALGQRRRRARGFR